jgi:hypothetical protein
MGCSLEVVDNSFEGLKVFGSGAFSGAAGCKAIDSIGNVWSRANDKDEHT